MHTFFKKLNSVSIWIALLSFLLISGCGPATPSASKPQATRPALPTQLSQPAEKPSPAVPTPQSPVSPTQTSGFQPGDAISAEVQTSQQTITTQIFNSDCVEVVTTPLVVDEYIIFGINKRNAKAGESDPNNCADDPSQGGVFAVSAISGEAFVLLQGIDVEGTPTYVNGQLIVPLVGDGGGIFWWQNGKGTQTHPLNTGTDSAGLWDATLNAYIIGSVNTPIPICQNGPNTDCGALIATTSSGNILSRLDRSNGLRGWTTGAPTSDGTFFYFGNGAGTDGASEPAGNPLNACSLLKIDRDFNILAAYDDGTTGCTAIGKLESAVVGEVPIADGVLWAQYLGSTDGSAFAPVVRLNATDLTPLCRAELPTLPTRSAAGFYQSPVIDEQSNAYVTAAYPENGMKASLYRISPDCAVTRLLDTASTKASTPTLADDQWVLIAETGLLHLVNRQTGVSQEITLPVNDDVRAGVVVSPYGVTIVTLHGTVITLKDTGLQGYGAAPWPRFRKDNWGSGQ